MTAEVNIWACFALLLLGVGFNVLFKLAGLEAQGQTVSPWHYVRARPYRSALLAVSTILLMLLLWVVDQLTYATAICMGIVSDQIADKLRAAAGAQIDGKLGGLR